MYEALSALLGIGLYFLAGHNETAAILLVVCVAAVAVLCVIATSVIGGHAARIGAAAPWFWSLLLIAIGSAAAWGLIALAATIIENIRHHNDPASQAVAIALDLVFAALIARLYRFSKHFGTQWATMQILQIRYGSRVNSFSVRMESTDPSRLAYEAARADAFNAGAKSAVEGWGYGARRKRFELAAQAPAATPTAAEPPQPA